MAGTNSEHIDRDALRVAITETLAPELRELMNDREMDVDRAADRFERQIKKRNVITIQDETEDSDNEFNVICGGGELSSPNDRCPSCGRTGEFIEENGVECHECGATLLEEGAWRKNDNWYCPSCHHDLDSKEEGDSNE